MGTIAVPNTFSANTTISSSQVNSNFSTIYNEFNGSIAAANLASDSVTTAKIADANVTTAKIATSAVDYTKVAAGAVVQVVNVTYSAVATGTTVIPYDDTIPQNTEGDQYMTLAITPKSATNILIIQANTYISNSAGNNLISALFQDSTANALAVTSNNADLAGVKPYAIPLQHIMTAGTTSSTTFKIRAGGNNAGTTTFNGYSGGRAFGAIPKSSIVITEYKA